VFGAAYFPARHEWPATGLADELEPAGLWDFIAAPFRGGRPTAAPDGRTVEPSLGAGV
jgi:hypothetical protein